ncbi:MAG: BON domain-containing protein [Planctomycetaceae bacterium]
MKTRNLLSIAGIISFALSSAAYAQTNSLFGNNGPTASTGGSRAGGTTAATGFGQATTPAGASGTAQFGQLNNTTGQGGLIGRNSNVGRFVGQQNAGQQNSRVNRNFQSAQNTARNANSRNTGADPFGARSGGSSSTTTLRPITRVAFRYPQRAMANVNVALRTRFTRLARRRPRFRGVNASLGGDGMVVLTGSVGSEDAKSLAANLARLEPGVRTVTNRLVVR